MNTILIVVPVIIALGVLITFLTGDIFLKFAYKRKGYIVGWKGVFHGHYIPHWEVSRFVWMNDVVKIEQWGNPGNCCMISNVTEMGNIPNGNISFLGEIEDVGSFGHKGLNMFRIRFLSWDNAA
jgi:hypothetical protein